MNTTIEIFTDKDSKMVKNVLHLTLFENSIIYLTLSDDKTYNLKVIIVQSSHTRSLARINIRVYVLPHLTVT